ncbi:protein FAR1-RELATED SEQUENCE 5-like [Citrus clementina]|uniref:protein FAR1-RELATED SEQUENCE 5-like n=1 Tax=Citrus clementina TaxID=85681 RepID=UPI000CED6D24|nr:protein FAR1-RELATED SEQUENCE 5-like [Citrus x clementina]
MNAQNVVGQSNCEDSLYVPEVALDRKPHKGQEFDTLDDAYEFYNKYAKEGGFSIRINSSKICKESNDIIRKEYVCFKEGQARQSKVVNRKRRRGIIRGGCSAKLVVVKSEFGKYMVRIFVEEHNHALSSPRRVHLLRSHRSMSVVQKNLSQQLAVVSIPTCQQIGLFELQAGGLQNMGCVQRDFYNNDRNLWNELKGHDADMLYEHFQSEKEKNSSFFYSIKAGCDDRITHCFWADVVCRRAYKFYGDVIVFDTTYNTNRYSMIFAPFVGVNNHGQTIVFGCGFLSDETTESFLWLFEQFKEAMPGDDPKMIITGQDPAMTKAISLAFPFTFHRFFIWHILNKFSERLSKTVHMENYRHFQKCIWESNAVEEFDALWKDVIDKVKLTENEWLQGVYEIRSKWVPAYVNHVFSVGMSSSQRAESNHAIFKRYVSKTNSLLDFVFRVNRALSQQRHEELIADNKDLNERSMLRLPLQIEKQMSEIYTCEIFYLFQDELWNSLLHAIELVRENEDYLVYNVVNQEDGVSKVFEVVYDKKLDFVSCICKKFESEGIPCTHMLALFKKLQISFMPNIYILQRWTKAAKLERVIDGDGVEINDCSNKSILLKRTKLFQLASNVIDKAVLSEATSKLVIENLEDALEKVKLVMKSCKSEGVLEKNSGMQQPHFNEPLQVRAKGCGKRLKGGKEKAKEKAKGKDKGRRCNGCGLVGQSHDKRNCPLLIKT